MSCCLGIYAIECLQADKYILRQVGMFTCSLKMTVPNNNRTFHWVDLIVKTWYLVHFCHLFEMIYLDWLIVETTLLQMAELDISILPILSWYTPKCIHLWPLTPERLDHRDVITIPFFSYLNMLYYEVNNIENSICLKRLFPDNTTLFHTINPVAPTNHIEVKT